MKLNTNSNTYIIVYSSIVVIIVAFLLAFVSKALEPASLANERIDKKKQILASLNIRNINNNEVEEQYNKCISYDKIIRSDGSVVDEGNNKDGAGFKVNMKDISDENLPVYSGSKSCCFTCVAEIGSENGVLVFIECDISPNTSP